MHFQCGGPFGNVPLQWHIRAPTGVVDDALKLCYTRCLGRSTISRPFHSFCPQELEHLEWKDWGPRQKGPAKRIVLE